MENHYFVKTLHISAGNVIFPDEVSLEESVLVPVSPLVAPWSDTSFAVTSRLEENVSNDQTSEFDETQPTELPDLTAEMNSEIRMAQRSRGEVRQG